jgi:hypothetical protein
MTDRLNEYDVEVNGVTLNNDWRKSMSGIARGRSTDNTKKMLGLEFVLEADDDADLAEKIAITEREFNVENPTVKAYRLSKGTGDDEVIDEFSPTDGESLGIYSIVTELPQEDSTEFSRYMYLEVSADLVQKSPTGIPRPGSPEVMPGLVEAIEIVEIESPGNIKTVSAGGIFQTITDETTIGPDSIVGVTENTTMAGTDYIDVEVADASAYSVDDYVQIQGTVRYNGKFLIKNTTATKITVDTPFKANEGAAGTIASGNLQLAKDLFDDAYADIKTLMGVGTDNMVIAGKTTQNLAGGEYEFQIVAQEQNDMPAALFSDGDTDLVRSIGMKVVSAELKEWETNGDLSAFGSSSTPPGAVIVDGIVTLRKESVTLALDEHWENDIKSAVLTKIDAHLNDTMDLQKIELTYDGSSPAIGFQIQGMIDFNDAFVLEYTTSEDIDHEAYIYSRGTLHGIQYKAAEDIKVISRTLMRVGVGEKDLSTLSAPTETGYVFHLHKEKNTNRGPLVMGEKSNVYIQSRTETYLRLKTS